MMRRDEFNAIVIGVEYVVNHYSKQEGWDVYGEIGNTTFTVFVPYGSDGIDYEQDADTVEQMVINVAYQLIRDDFE